MIIKRPPKGSRLLSELHRGHHAKLQERQGILSNPQDGLGPRGSEEKGVRGQGERAAKHFSAHADHLLPHLYLGRDAVQGLVLHRLQPDSQRRSAREEPQELLRGLHRRRGRPLRARHFPRHRQLFEKIIRRRAQVRENIQYHQAVQAQLHKVPIPVPEHGSQEFKLCRLH